ncbi:G-protein coupled receptors family 1 profile domain-containing protein [Caenorhabditis elegans]|uniref:G-protein coupled receptors family 1 profile domain-containing protein n=1 Tax=Caenorhabditis elegans TaxID=6239 RepID=O17030_CAEEL|nr:G-protein coupled receptors family 1 profile domain-containing protein [Caenorhabditis elegans]CCD68164.1 G-protein coupled receptors family 1 profile domain-containing protein [Caenorhabditis elegans]|eukprot:NP_504730.1 DroMyoSuppressin Receptor related [Caenorhabditis elegans]
MASALNCTQFTVPYPEPGTDEVGNSTIPWLITTVVKAYRPFHYYILTFLVVFAFFANIMIVKVLSHKEMIRSGVNVTMLLIAVCDFGCSIAGLLQLFLRSYSDNYTSYPTAYGQIAVDYLAVAFHASSLYLAVGMAFCRVKSLNIANRNKDLWQSPNYAVRVACALCAPVFLIATFVLFINAVKNTEEEGIYLDISDLSLLSECLFMKASLMASGLCFKIAPCLLMLVLSLFLLRRIDEGKQSAQNAAANQKGKKDKIDRSSRFIQFVLVVFLITESPQGVFSILGGFMILDYINYFQNLSIFMNILAFFNTTTSFIIYSSLSAKFRRIFAQLFLPSQVLEKIYLKRSTVVVHSIAHSSRTV